MAVPISTPNPLLKTPSEAVVQGIVFSNAAANWIHTSMSDLENFKLIHIVAIAKIRGPWANIIFSVLVDTTCQ